MIAPVMHRIAKPRFFATAAKLRIWFDTHHESRAGLWVGYYKRDSGRPSITWPESVDAALSFGWIEGIRKSLDTASYMIRFTPRKATSIWSAVNMRRAEELIRLGLMQPRGHAAYGARRENRSGVYAYEQRSVDLPPLYARRMQTDRAAWADYRKRPPHYRKTVNWWVLSAKTEVTRLRRLDQLIACSAAGEKLRQYAWNSPQAKSRKKPRQAS